jgi:hypothetical protein
MLRTLLLLTVVVCLATTTAAAQATREEVLPAGMLVQCVLDEPHFSSSTAEIGDPVLCHVGTLGVFGHSAFPRGAYLAGRFQDFRDPGRFFGKGWIALTFDRLVLPGAVTLPLSAKVISVPHLRVDREGKIHGLGHPKRDAIGWAIPVLWPVKVFTLPARGPRPTLKGEVRMTLRLLEDIEIPATNTASRTTSWRPKVSQFRPSSTGIFSPQFPRGGSTVEPATREISTAVHGQGQTNSITVDFADRPPVQQLTLLILKGGSGYLASDYWLEGTRLHLLTPDGDNKLLPLERLDLEGTVRLNRERNVEFVLRSQDRSQP